MHGPETTVPAVLAVGKQAPSHRYLSTVVVRWWRGDNATRSLAKEVFEPSVWLPRTSIRKVQKDASIVNPRSRKDINRSRRHLL